MADKPKETKVERMARYMKIITTTKNASMKKTYQGLLDRDLGKKKSKEIEDVKKTKSGRTTS